MASKVWLGLGAAALAGFLYYVTRPIEVDRRTGLRKKAESKAPSRPVICPPKDGQSPLKYEDGILTTESVVFLLSTMKDVYWQTMEDTTREFREERRQVGYQNMQKYVESIQNMRMQQGRLFDEIFQSTLAAYGVDQLQIRKYNEKYGPSVFYSQLEKLAMNHEKPPEDLSMDAEGAAYLIEQKFALMQALLSQAPLTPESLLLNSYVAEDLIYEKHGVEDEEIAAQAKRFQDNPIVKEALEKLNSLIPK